MEHTSVPNYNMYGQQHPREPVKDKSVYLSSGVTHHKWFDPPPAIRSRSELMQARKCSNIPDRSYDFDGDGVVGQTDFLIGRYFDKNADGCLTPKERRKAEKALSHGFMDGFRKVDAVSGGDVVGRRVQQVGGVIMDEHNAPEVAASLYPPHHNSHVVPNHATLSELRQSRKIELNAAANDERYTKGCATVLEPQPANAKTHPRTCPIAHIRERSEADHQHSRTQGGLLPTSTMVNPEREHMTVGLGYRESPPCATRSELIEKRRDDFKRTEQELRLKLDEFAVPHSVRKREKERQREAKFYENALQGEPKTRNALKDSQRRDRREYDNANFCLKERQLPRFSDNPDVPFWIAGTPEKVQQRQANLAASANKNVREASRAHSEPVPKVTEAPFRPTGLMMQRNAPAVAATATVSASLDTAAGKPEDKLFANKRGTVKRFTADYLERGLGLNKPRLFDSIQPIRVGPLDLQSLDATSSMEIIRRGALSDQNTEKKANHLMRRSILYSEPGIESVEQESVDTTPHASLFVGEPGLSRSPRKRATNAAPRVQSDASLRTLAERTQPTGEPRSFASTTTTLVPSSQVGVRCGGFQRLDWPPRNARQEQTRRSGKSKERLQSNQSSVRDGVGAVQPL